MKLTKKKVLVTSLAVSLIAILSFGTIAWFTDTDSVTNDFKVADSDDTESDIFNVDVYEKYDADGDNVDETYEVGIDYENVTPNATYRKEAYVKNTGKYGQYVRVKASVTDVKTWAKAFDETVDADNLTVANILALSVDLADVFGGVADFDAKWDLEKDEIVYDATAENGTLTYVYYYKEVLTAGTEVQFLESVTVPSVLTQTQVVEMDGNFKISIKAEAVQSDNTGDNAQDAFALVNM